MHLLVHVRGKDGVVTDQPGESVEENVRAQCEAQKQVGDLIFLDHKNDLHYLRSTAHLIFVTTTSLDALYRTSRFIRYEAEGERQAFSSPSPHRSISCIYSPSRRAWLVPPDLGSAPAMFRSAALAPLADAPGNSDKPPTAQPPRE
jgi:hypothetical protein